MSAATSYRIAAVAQATGLSSDTIRMWERRYGLIEPARDSAGVRRYSEADVERLRLARGATMLGHAISDVARLSNDDLRGIVNASRNDAPIAAPTSMDGAKAHYVDTILESIVRLDVTQAEKQLNEAFFLLEARDVIIDIMAPLMHRIGEQWSQGRLQIVHEHAASQIVRNASANAFRLAAKPAAVRLVFATPPGERHDFGISFAANLAVLRGAQVFVLGADLPLDELLSGARRIGPAGLVASATVSPVQPDVAKFFEQLDKQLPNDIEISVGGPGALALDTTRWSDRTRIVASLRDFDANLDRFGV